MYTGGTRAEVRAPSAKGRGPSVEGPGRRGSCTAMPIWSRLSCVRRVLHPQLCMTLTLALCALWAVTPLIVAACVTMPTHCQRRMPCCPHSGSPSKNCAPGLCPAEASQRALPTRTAHVAPLLAIPLPAALDEPAVRISVRELTAGLYYSPPVFRLKDDLRI